MKLHLVGGFLGSGKTTAIINASKQLVTQGKRVGVVTNDQGKYLVDTAFFRLNDVPTIEVTGGCFCCHYDDLEDRLDQLTAEVRPDVIFAESVGSCADLVATVIKPLINLRSSEFQPASFSVFTDGRLLEMRLLGEGLPFSENIVYLFDKQIEEASVLIINKCDLLEPEDAEALAAAARIRFPGKVIRLQDSTNPDSIREWTALIEAGTVSLPLKSLNIDYQRYGEGESRLAWLDEEILLFVPDGTGNQVVQRLISAFLEAIDEQKATVGHLKFMIRGGEVDAEVGISTAQETDWRAHLPLFLGKQISMLVNGRVEIDAVQLRELFGGTLKKISMEMKTEYRELTVNYFHPSPPRPTHRME
jgi:Ni2+-binding GTPase involved in maturation of urease and hydrogenase